MKNLLPFLLLFVALSTFSQKEANFWYFGFNAGLDFTDCNPVAITDGKLSTFEGCSTISNGDGELLFYSDGTTAWNKNHNIMPGGTGLLGNSSSAQSALFVPNPINKNIYYLFVVGNQNEPGFFYYTIDLNTNGGLGSVIDGPEDLNNGSKASWTERVTAIQSNKSDEFWIISASLTTLHSYKVTKDGVDLSSLAISSLSTDIGTRGSLKISPDGSKLVITSQDNDCLLYDFNTTNGIASNNRRINVSGGNSYGAEFSQSGNKLYISTGNHNQGGNPPRESLVYQYDLSSETVTEINASRQTIVSWTGYRGALQLGPDARIYYAKSGEASLGVINNPEEVGVNVDYIHNGLELGGRISSEGLPPFIQSFFKVALTDLDTGTKITEEFLICTGDTKRLGINAITDFDDTADTTKPIVYEWYRDDELLNDETTSIITVGGPGRITSGTYTLKASYTNECNRKRSLEAVAQVVFYDKPIVNTIPVYEQCDIDSNPNDFITNFNLTTKETEIYTGTDNVSITFYETSDTSFSSPITKNDYRNSTPTDVVNGNHKIIVQVKNTDTNCYQIEEIELKVNPSGTDSYPDIYTCELNLNENISGSRNSEGSANSFYDLDDKTNQIIANSSGALDTATHDFSYYRTNEDAALQTNEIIAPYEDDLFINNDDIFIRISLKGTNACESVGKFKINIQDLPIPKGNNDDINLCVNNPRDNPQLITTDLDADTGVSSDTYVWYFNGNLIPNETNAILKANNQGEYKVEASRLYVNDTSSSTDDFTCIGYNTFTVVESSVALVESFSFVDDQDDPADNTFTVTITGEGNYEFALNDNTPSNFVKGPENLTYTFTDVPPGLNKIYINDKDECGVISTQEVSFVFFQRHLTPNGDGLFDTWKILGVENNFYREVKLQIFDRYGKILKDIDQKTNNGWDGTFNGKILPSNDYWYNAILVDLNGNIRNKTGHFSLLRK